jgi:hypothetical protein
MIGNITAQHTLHASKLSTKTLRWARAILKIYGWKVQNPKTSCKSCAVEQTRAVWCMSEAKIESGCSRNKKTAHDTYTNASTQAKPGW